MKTKNDFKLAVGGPLLLLPLVAALVVLLNGGSAGSVRAQQTVFNVPIVVISPQGKEHEVLVRIGEEAISYVERMTRRKLPPESSFWTAQAKRRLADFLWTEGQAPPTGKLAVKEIDRDELAVAERWAE